MTNLLSNLNLQQPENATSDILVYLLNGIPAYKKAFLALIGDGLPEDCTIDREQCIIDRSRPDFIAESKDWIAVIENKPWNTSNLGVQFSDYAKALKKREKAGNKYLCLLAPEKEKDRLLGEIAKNELVNIDSIPIHFQCEYGIHVSVLTWNKVLDTLNAIQPENEAAKLWLDALRTYIIPPERLLTPEDIATEQSIVKNWDTAKAIISDTKIILQKMLPIYGYTGVRLLSGGKEITGSNSYGWYIYDPVNKNIQYWIGIDQVTWAHFRSIDIKHYLFIVRAYRNLNKEEVISSAILEQCGFKRDKKHYYDKHTYVYPLRDTADVLAVTPQNLAGAIVVALNGVRDALAKQYANHG